MTEISHTAADKQQALRRRRLTLILLAALFFAPLVASFLIYYGGEGWRPRETINKGELVTPVRALPEVTLTTPANEPTGQRFLRDKWHLIYIASMPEGECDARCREALYQIRQVRLSFNEKAERIERVLLYSGSCCEEPLFPTEHAGLAAASVDSADGRRLLEAFEGLDDAPALGAGRIYISDPLGNLVLSYPAGTDPSDIRDDLNRLLKLSHIG